MTENDMPHCPPTPPEGLPWYFNGFPVFVDGSLQYYEPDRPTQGNSGEIDIETAIDLGQLSRSDLQLAKKAGLL